MTTLTQEQFKQLVEDFEYEVIDQIVIGDSLIQWQPEEETCFEFVDGEVVNTGSFEHLLEWFVA